MTADNRKLGIELARKRGAYQGRQKGSKNRPTYGPYQLVWSTSIIDGQQAQIAGYIVNGDWIPHAEF
jgi:hypothetical protein